MEPRSKVNDLTPAEAAKYLGVHPGTLANWRAWGIGPKFTRKDRKIRYTHKALEDYAAKGSAA